MVIVIRNVRKILFNDQNLALTCSTLFEDDVLSHARMLNVTLSNKPKLSDV